MSIPLASGEAMVSCAWPAALRSTMASLGCQPDMESGLKADSFVQMERPVAFTKFGGFKCSILGSRDDHRHGLQYIIITIIIMLVYNDNKNTNNESNNNHYRIQQLYNGCFNHQALLGRCHEFCSWHIQWNTIPTPTHGGSICKVVPIWLPMTLVRSLRTQRQQVGLLELIGSNWLVSEGCLGVSFGKTEIRGAWAWSCRVLTEDSVQNVQGKRPYAVLLFCFPFDSVLPPSLKTLKISEQETSRNWYPGAWIHCSCWSCDE